MPTQETKQTLNIPGFTYRDFEVPNLELSTSLIDNLGTSRSAYELAPESAPLMWRVALYRVGRDLHSDYEGVKELPESDKVREAGQLIYERCQNVVESGWEGTWHKDAVLFEPRTTIPGDTRPGPDYVPARYFIDIDGFEQTEDGWEILTNPETREERLWLPPGSASFIVPGKYHNAYHSVTGTPIETVGDREEAIKRWMKTGLNEEQAIRELSRFYRRNSGTAAVHSGSGDYYGPLCVCLGPWGRFSGIGSFPASRSAERSEAPKNSGTC